MLTANPAGLLGASFMLKGNTTFGQGVNRREESHWLPLSVWTYRSCHNTVTFPHLLYSSTTTGNSCSHTACPSQRAHLGGSLLWSNSGPQIKAHLFHVIQHGFTLPSVKTQHLVQTLNEFVVSCFPWAQSASGENPGQLPPRGTDSPVGSTQGVPSASIRGFGR